MRYWSKENNSNPSISAKCETLEVLLLPGFLFIKDKNAAWIVRFFRYAPGGVLFSPFVSPLWVYAVDKAFHSVCAVLLHLLGYMTVDVQGERCCGVA